MTAETSNARGEWVLVPREPTKEMLAATSWPGCAASDYAHMLAAAPQPPSAPVGVELFALRVQEWLHREHDILCPVQEIEQAMRTPCSCPFTERTLAQQPAAVDEAMVERAWVAFCEDTGPARAAMRAALTAALAAQQQGGSDDA